MNYERFKNYIQKHVDLSEQEWGLIKQRLSVTRYKKGEIIHSIGDISSHLHYINYGIARAFTIDENGKDYTWSIYFNDDNAHTVNLFVVDYESFINQNSSRLEIEALEDCELISMTFDDCNYLNQTYPKLQDFAKMMVDNAYSYLHNIIIDRQTKSAKQRFDEFIQNTPHLLDKVPQYHIASLLDMTPQHLSRLKSKINLCE